MSDQRRTAGWIRRNAIGLLGLTLAAIFAGLWITSIGIGRLQLGTLGEWLSALGTAAAFGITLFVLLHERRNTRLAARKGKLDRTIGEEIRLGRLSETEVPVLVQVLKPDATCAKHRLKLRVGNYSPHPLTRLKVTWSITGDWTGMDHQELGNTFDALEEAGDVASLAELLGLQGFTTVIVRDLLPPSEEEVVSLELNQPINRIEQAGMVSTTWNVGEYSYRDSYFVASGRQHRSAQRRRPPA